MHLLFYDGECGFCDHTVRFLLHADKQKLFIFAPLQGSTAKKVLMDLPEGDKGVDSLILVENYQTDRQRFYTLGKGALRVAWLLGGFWKVIGLLSFLPGWFFNWGYRFIAANRHRFFSQSCELPDPKNRDRFLD